MRAFGGDCVHGCRILQTVLPSHLQVLTPAMYSMLPGGSVQPRATGWAPGLPPLKALAATALRQRLLQQVQHLTRQAQQQGQHGQQERSPAAATAPVAAAQAGALPQRPSSVSCRSHSRLAAGLSTDGGCGGTSASGDPATLQPRAAAAYQAAAGQQCAAADAASGARCSLCSGGSGSSSGRNSAVSSRGSGTTSSWRCSEPMLVPHTGPPSFEAPAAMSRSAAAATSCASLASAAAEAATAAQPEVAPGYRQLQGGPLLDEPQACGICFEAGAALLLRVLPCSHRVCGEPSLVLSWLHAACALAC